MRLKHIKGSEEVMLTSPHITQEPQTLRGAWKRPGEKLFLEIGMGKGQFITQKASADPDNIYIGIEKYSSVMLRAVEKQEQLMLPNLRLIRVDAEQMGEIFAPGEVDAVFLNFSDPWPKDRHAKRRLTSPQFLARYAQILAPGGSVEFKTDNMALFDYSVESFRSSGWEITALTRDLHADPVLSAGNVMTEYEERFSSKGNPIAKLIAVPPLFTTDNNML